MSEFDYEGIELDEDDDNLQMTSVYERDQDKASKYNHSISAAADDHHLDNLNLKNQQFQDNHQ